MACAIAYPCSGRCCRVWRISIASVPWSTSMRSALAVRLDMGVRGYYAYTLTQVPGRRSSFGLPRPGAPAATCPAPLSLERFVIRRDDRRQEHIMKARIDLMHVNPGVVHAMLGLERQVLQAKLDAKL